MSAAAPPPALWARLLARWWYAWGMRLCSFGGRMHDRSFILVQALPYAILALP
jgi:prephenate dehydrogenase